MKTENGKNVTKTLIVIAKICRVKNNYFFKLLYKAIIVKPTFRHDIFICDIRIKDDRIFREFVKMMSL